MKKVLVLVSMVFLPACTESQLEEFAFRKTLEYDMVETCGEDKSCVKAVEEQVANCMVSSQWRQYLENQDDEAELERFATEVYACIKDTEGKAYFY